VGCSPHSEAGYATPAALIFALGLALVATAMVARSVMLLRQMRADLTQTQAELVLDGAHLLAAATVVRAGEGGPYVWSLPTDAGLAEAHAEAEGLKLSPEVAAELPEGVFVAMGVGNVSTVRAALRAAPAGAPDIASLDAAPLWRACATGLISGLGKGARATLRAPSEPRLRPETPDWRVGELWRIRITTPAGWRDDRLVRFTGDAQRPAAVVRRVLSRGQGGQGRCEPMWTALGLGGMAVTP
jgi:hypothetical protein